MIETAPPRPMPLRPESPEALAASLRAAQDAGRRVAAVDLSGLPRVLEHVPEDMTVTVDAGCTLAALQAELGRHGQWLPIDPPHPGQLTIATLLDRNLSGPRRCGHGTVREHLLGLRVALADGRLIRSGGRVVKNVAGYDLLKLFVGAQGTLGVIVEATFKLLPRPESELLLQCACPSLEDAGARIGSVLDSELVPTILDLHCVDGSPEAPGPLTLVLGLAGSPAAVDWQRARAAQLGFDQPGSLAYDADFHALHLPVARPRSVLPSRLIDAVRSLGRGPFVARAAQGTLYHRSDATTTATPPTTAAGDPIRELGRRLKATFDPRGVFPDFPL